MLTAIAYLIVSAWVLTSIPVPLWLVIVWLVVGALLAITGFGAQTSQRRRPFSGFGKNVPGMQQ